MVAHSCNPSSLEAEAGVWLWDQPGLQSKTLPNKQAMQVQAGPEDWSS